MNTSLFRAWMYVCVISFFYSGVYVNAEAPKSGRMHVLSTKQTRGRIQRIRVSLKVEGQLKVIPLGSKKIIELPLSAVGEVSYDERLVSTSPTKTLRYYDLATAKIKVGDGGSTQSVRQSRRLIAFSEQGFYSPWGPLTREELDMVNVPGNSALVDRLLPGGPVTVGAKWKPKLRSLARFLDIDVVSESSVTCTLSEVSGENAVIRIEGTIEGGDGGVAVQIKVQGNLTFDLVVRQVKSLSLTLHDTRPIAHAVPGLEVTAKLEMAVSPRDSSQELSDAAVKRTARAEPSAHLLSYRSNRGKFELLHDRDWHLMVDSADVSVLRRVVRGDLVAQCNMSRLEDRGDKQLTLEDFQVDVRRVLGDRIQQLLEARESTTNTGLRILRVTVQGNVAELPIQWIYYHVQDEQGHRVSLVFPMESKLAEKLEESDRAMAVSVRMFPRKDRVAPTSAKPMEN